MFDHVVADRSRFKVRYFTQKLTLSLPHSLLWFSHQCMFYFISEIFIQLWEWSEVFSVQWVWGRVKIDEEFLFNLTELMHTKLCRKIWVLWCVLKHSTMFKSGLVTIMAPTFKKITDNSDKNCRLLGPPKVNKNK